MRKVFRHLGFVLGALILGALSLALYVNAAGFPRYPHVAPRLHVEITPERVERGHKLASVLCASCHLDPKTGELTGKRLTDAPPEFGAIYSRNITRHPVRGIGAWTDGEVALLLRTGIGRDGRYVPPYMVKLPHLSDEDLASIIAFLRSDDPWVAPADLAPPGVTQPSFLTKALSRTVFRPLPYPDHVTLAPPKADRVASGRYAVFALDCFSCHSSDFKTVNVAEPEKSEGYLGGGNELLDTAGRIVRSANITPDDETGIGRWSEDDFVRALKKGIKPGGAALRYPMVAMPELDDEEAAGIYAYLRTVPKIHNAVARAPDESVTNEGERVYQKYGCVGCHGADGSGPLADLRHANDDYPTDEALRAWLDNAPTIRPGTKMPAWKGIVQDADYAPLLAHVRTLARARG